MNRGLRRHSTIAALALGLVAAACSQAPAPLIVKSASPPARPAPTIQVTALDADGDAGGPVKPAPVMEIVPDQPPLPRVKPPRITVVHLAPVQARQTVRVQRAPVPKPLVKPLVAPLVVQPIAAVRAQRGDTVYAISRRHRVAVREIIVLNRLQPPYKLALGQVLRLPTGRFHTVQPGDTVYGVSRRHGVDMNALVRANRIPPPYRLQIGQRLRLPPRNRAVAAVTGASIAPEHKITASVVAVRAVAPEPPPSVRESLPAKPPKRAGGKFLWPVNGKVVSTFGAKAGGTHNDGINIAVARGSPVHAAENGVVAYAGNELRGYGELLLIRHAGGWMTAYAHNDRLLVRRGDIVKRGQIISRAGNTGNVKKPQAHFEIRRNGKALNPLKHLARQ